MYMNEWKKEILNTVVISKILVIDFKWLKYNKVIGKYVKTFFLMNTHYQRLIKMQFKCLISV